MAKKPSAIGTKQTKAQIISALAESTGVTNVAATVIRIVRGDGTLVVEVDDAFPAEGDGAAQRVARVLDQLDVDG